MPPADPIPSTRPVDPAVLRALLERVRAAEGPDREIDALLEDTIGSESKYPGSHIPYALKGGRPEYLRIVAPAFTRSLDAAIRLLERVLPGMDCTLAFPGMGSELNQPTARVRFEALSSVEDDGPTMPLALCSALLSALLATAEPHHAE